MAFNLFSQPSADSVNQPTVGLLGNASLTPEMLMALGGGIMSGQNLGEGLSNGFTNAGAVMTAQRARQQAVATKNATIAMLQDKSPDLAAQVKAGAISPEAAVGELWKQQAQAKEDAKPKFVVVNGRLVQTNGGDKPSVVEDFSDPMANAPADAKSTAYWLAHPDEYKAHMQQEKDKADLRNNGDSTLTPLQKDLAAAGLKPDTPEYQQAILNARKLGAKPGQISPKLSEDQSKNVGFLIRARNAEKVLSDPAVLNDPKNAADPNAIPSTNETQGLSRWNQFANALPLGIGNSIISSDAQNYNQAKLNFITAALRKESGAAISQSEYDNAEKTYFPQPGDGKQQIEQKRQAREDVIKGFEISAGPGAEMANQNDQQTTVQPTTVQPTSGKTTTGRTWSVQQ
jgi:broad specificity polyphosphatase/5'/3'-nucleotidase SurE